MRDLLPKLAEWREAGHRFATATVVETWGSSPRPVGAMLAVRDDGLSIGSVSGGCVEAAVQDAARESLANGRPSRLVFPQIAARDVWEVGLTCGGRLEVWIEPEPYEDPAWRSAVEAATRNRPVALVTRYDPHARWIASEPQETGQVEIAGELCFVHAIRPRDRLLIVGASHIALPLIQMAKVLDFECIVVDPRSGLLDPERFPESPDQAHPGWPQSVLPELEITDATYAVLLSHDPKIDDPALEILLRSPAAYIGALGSRATQAERRESLRRRGVTEGQLDRIHGPIGLNIGARSPQEIAVAILAEIIQARRG